MNTALALPDAPVASRRRRIDPTLLVLPAALVLMIVVFAVLSTTFFTVDNLFVILRQSAVLGVAAIGATMILIAGRLDISSLMRLSVWFICHALLKI